MGNRLMDAWNTPNTGNIATDNTEEKIELTVNEQKKVGRPQKKNESGRIKKTTTLRMYDEDLIYCKLRAKQVSSENREIDSASAYISYLIERDKRYHQDIAETARTIAKLQ